MKRLLPLGLFFLGGVCNAANGPSLDYLEKNINKVSYADVVMEVGPPNKKEVLPDGSIIAMWSYDITQMDALPASVAVRANPSDPECAKRAVEEAIGQIIRAIHNSEGAFA